MPKRTYSRSATTQPSLPDVPLPEIKGPQASESRALAAPKPQRQGGELFIVDNSDEQWKAAQYLAQWCDIARSLGIGCASKFCGLRFRGLISGFANRIESPGVIGGRTPRRPGGGR